jgi:hypothetical protein
VSAAAIRKPLEAMAQMANAGANFASTFVRFRGGQFRVVLKIVPQTPEDGAALSARQPAIHSLLLSAANEYARLNVSTFRPVNVKTLRKSLLDAVRKPGHKVKDVLVIDALAF